MEDEIKKNLLFKSDFWPITEEKLAKRFNVSRLPVRILLTKLEQENLVIRKNKSGTIPKIPSHDEIVKLYNVRCVLEPYSASLAAENANQEDIQCLEKIAEEFSLGLSKNDKILQAQSDLSFHYKVATISDNLYIVQTMASLNLICRSFFANVDAETTEVDPYTHEMIVQAIKNGDSEAAGLVMKQHLAWVIEKMIQESV